MEKVVNEPRMNSRTSRAVAGTITSLLQYAILMVLQFALAPVVLRVAGQQVLGAYSFLMQMITWAALTDLGFGVAISRSLAQANGLDDQRGRFCAVFTTGRTFYVGSNLAFALLILLIGWKINFFMSMDSAVEWQSRWSLCLLAVWVALRTPIALFGDALIATQNLAAVNITVAVSSALRLLLSLGLVMLGAGLIGLVLANIVAEAATLIVVRAWYRKLYPNDRFGWGIPNRALFREMLGFGLTYMMMIVAGRLSAGTDSIIVGYLYGAAAVSVYYTSLMPGTVFYQLIWKLTDNAAPAMNELYARQVVPQLTAAYLRLLRYSLLLVIPLALGLLAFNRYAVTLWVGPSQYAGGLLTAALAVYAVTQVVNHLNAIVMVAYGDIRRMSVFSLCGGIVKVILAFWLGGIVGLAGVILANALVDTLGFIYFSRRVWRLLGLPVRQVWHHALTPALKASIVTLIVLLVVVVRPFTATWPTLLLWVAVFVFAWAVGTGSAGLLRMERVQLYHYMKRVSIPAFERTDRS